MDGESVRAREREGVPCVAWCELFGGLRGDVCTAGAVRELMSWGALRWGCDEPPLCGSRGGGV